MGLAVTETDMGKQGKCSRCGAEFPIAPSAIQPASNSTGVGRVFVVPAPEPGQGHATAALVLGLLGMLLGSFTLSILGIIFGSLGLKSFSRHGQAVAGLTMGCIGLPLAILAKFLSVGFCCFTL